MKKIPNKIYLQINPFNDSVNPEDGFYDDSSATWCEDRIEESDIEYVIVDKEEEKVKNELEAIQKHVFGKVLRSYSTLDLSRFGRLKVENPNVQDNDLVKLYNLHNPEISNLQKLKNLSEGLDLPELLDDIDTNEFLEN